MFPPSLQALINQFNKLPGIGPKTAERFVFYLLRRPKEELEKFAQALLTSKNKIKLCSSCYNFTEAELCPICADPRRDPSIICLVAQSTDLIALEKTGDYKGIYHVLGGALSPIEGITPEKIRIKELIQRIDSKSETRTPKVKEIILAFNPDLEGESTILYLVRLLKSYKIKITRLARGLPMGSDLEYADEVTLSSALEGRREV